MTIMFRMNSDYYQTMCYVTYTVTFSKNGAKISKFPKVTLPKIFTLSVQTKPLIKIQDARYGDPSEFIL